MAGLLLCAFFILGVITGFSEPGRRLTARLSRLMCEWAARTLNRAEPVRNALEYFRQEIAPLEGIPALGRLARTMKLPRPREKATSADRPAYRSPGTVALIEKGSGFYALSAEGGLAGPVSPTGQTDLPVLSGSGVENADAVELVRDAAMLVRTEAELSNPVSEMQLERDGTATLFLERARMEIVIDSGREAPELHRALQVLRLWQGRERLIARLDMTAPGLAVVRLRAELPRPQGRLAKREMDRHKSARNGNAGVRIARGEP